MRRMIGVLVGFTCTSISARYALAQRLLVAYSPNRRGARCRAHDQRRVSGSGKRSWSIRSPSPLLPPQRLCGGAVLRGTVCGARTTGTPDQGRPIRPTPALRQISPGGVFCRQTVFLTGRGRFLLSRQKKRGADSPENFRSPPGPPGKAPDEGLNQAGSLIRPPAAATFPHGKALRSRWVDPPSAPTGAPGSAGQRLTAGFSVRPSR